MPLFDYWCEECNGVIFKDHLVSNASEIIYCPACNNQLRRMFPDHTSFSLKGGGWEKDSYNKPQPIPPVGDSD